MYSQAIIFCTSLDGRAGDPGGIADGAATAVDWSCALVLELACPAAVNMGAVAAEEADAEDKVRLRSGRVVAVVEKVARPSAAMSVLGGAEPILAVKCGPGS